MSELVGGVDSQLQVYESLSMGTFVGWNPARLQCTLLPASLSEVLCQRSFALPLQIQPYVNGALYSILSVPSIREEARAMVRRYARAMGVRSVRAGAVLAVLHEGSTEL